MDKKFNLLYRKAYGIVTNKIVNLGDAGIFSWIYPFTTENINGYINMFDLENKSLLTIGSSGDQVINASLKNCKDITVLDINPFTKFYFYLKKAALLTLDYKEFAKFFCYEDYPKVFKLNSETFSLDSYKTFKSNLKELDLESFIFWDTLFNNCKSIDIRKNLFEHDEERLSVVKEMNLYLKDEDMFNKSKIKIKNINPKFIIGNIFTAKLERKYDNIFLSNLGTYCSVETLKVLIDKLSLNLNEDGKMLMCYLYRTTMNTKYRDEWDPIYDLDKTFEVLGDYITSFESFQGVQGLKFEDENMKDSVMIYQKKRTD
ncbi:MAG: DUF3419 family protein [Bacilli bacterium]|nr:DUF3419 family protein [Bacilli bacterium]